MIADRAREIYEGNREALPNPDLLPIGKVLKIPPRAALADTRTQSAGTERLGEGDVVSPGAQPDAQALPVERANEPLDKQGTGGQTFRRAQDGPPDGAHG